MFRRHFTAIVLASIMSAVAVPAADALARFGPPWLSIELPANPLDPTTKGAYLVVRTYHHDKSIPMIVEGRFLANVSVIA